MIAGCHTVRLGGWTPAAEGAVADAAAPGLPERVVLDTTLAPQPMAFGLAVRAARGMAAGPYRLGYWMPLGAGVRVVWSTGVGGGSGTIDARVVRGADGVLRGIATTTGADAGAPARRATIELAPVPCDAR